MIRAYLVYSIALSFQGVVQITQNPFQTLAMNAKRETGQDNGKQTKASKQLERGFAFEFLRKKITRGIQDIKRLEKFPGNVFFLFGKTMSKTAPWITGFVL